MTVFRADRADSIPQTVFDERAPIRFLECSIYACLLSHIREKENIIPEIAIAVSNKAVRLTTPKKYGMMVYAACKECFILNNLKFSWVIKMEDEAWEKIKKGEDSD